MLRFSWQGNVGGGHHTGLGGCPPRQRDKTTWNAEHKQTYDADHNDDDDDDDDNDDDNDDGDAD
eukprot:4131755-Karenia_brevis.AAC.1